MITADYKYRKFAIPGSINYIPASPHCIHRPILEVSVVIMLLNVTLLQLTSISTHVSGVNVRHTPHTPDAEPLSVIRNVLRYKYYQRQLLTRIVVNVLFEYPSIS